MATFGKVLLFLNIFLVIIVLTMFGLNVGQEKRWATAAYISGIPPVGLPMDGDEVDPEDPSAKRVDKLTSPVMDAFFDFQDDQTLGQKARVKTVLEELERVRTIVQRNITNANPDEQRKLLAGHLIPQAKTMIEREELIRRVNDPKEPIANLISEMDRRFSEAKTPSGRTARAEQRIYIATLLFNLHNDTLWRQRVMRIVGMQTYVEAVERQAQYTYTMALEYQALIKQDLASFEKSYADLVNVILKDSEDLYIADKFLRDLNATLAERQTQVMQRQGEVQAAQKALDIATKNTQDEIKQLNAIQTDLFQLQLRVGQAIKKNHELEQDLRNLENRKPGL